jgi:hypothetical protein
VAGFVLPILALFALWWKPARDRATDVVTVRHIRFFGLVLGVGLLMLTGANEPIGPLKTWLFQELGLIEPFRSVYQRFGPYVALAYAPLVAAGIQAIASRRAHSSGRRYVNTAVGAASALAMLLPAWPLMSGDLYDRSGIFPSNRIRIPTEYVQVARLLDRQRGDFLVVAVPLPGTATTSLLWRRGDEGFRGIEPLSLLSSKPFLFQDAAAPYLASLLRAAIRNPDRSADAMVILNVRYVVVHRDAHVEYLAGLRGVIGRDAAAIETKLRRAEDFRVVFAGRYLAVYEWVAWRASRVFAVQERDAAGDGPLTARPLRYRIVAPGRYQVTTRQVETGELVVVGHPYDKLWRANDARPIVVAPGFAGFHPTGGDLTIEYRLQRPVRLLAASTPFVALLSVAVGLLALRRVSARR